MEDDGLCLDLPVLDVDLVAGENDGDVLAHSHQVSVPVRHVLVRNTGGNVEHDNCALALNVIAVPQSTKLLLTSGVPHVEPDGSTVCVEDQWVNLHTKSCHILLLKLTSQMALDKGGLAGATVADENQLEGGYVFPRCHLACYFAA